MSSPKFIVAWKSFSSSADPAHCFKLSRLMLPILIHSSGTLPGPWPKHGSVSSSGSGVVDSSSDSMDESSDSSTVRMVMFSSASSFSVWLCVSSSVFSISMLLVSYVVQLCE